MELQKFTTLYDRAEDRLCINGETLDGGFVSLWLTCRLMRQLLPALLKLVTPAAEAADEAGRRAAWALATARAEQRPLAAVTKPSVQAATAVDIATAAPCLVKRVDLNRSPNRAVLIFRAAAEQELATIGFTPERLRQWLGIVHGLWLRAAWPAEDWPAWVREAEAPSAPEGVILH